MTDDQEETTIDVKYSVPQADLFHRGQPAILEGPRQIWEGARTVIDFGCALLAVHNRLRDERKLRDATLVALLRRALVTAEGVCHLLAHGLHEDALVLLRTLMDIDVNLKLIVRDSTDRMAKRYAAYHYYGSQRHGQRMLADRETRNDVLEREGVERTIAVARSYARFLEEAVFNDVRDEVRGSQYWHGYPNVREAFAAAGTVSDYYMSYDSFTFFVHDTNVDFDFADIQNGHLQLKPLVERNPAIFRVPLGLMILRMHSIYSAVISDRGLPPELAGSTPEIRGAPPGPVLPQLEVSSFDGLTHYIAELLRVRDEDVRAADDGAPVVESQEKAE